MKCGKYGDLNGNCICEGRELYCIVLYIKFSIKWIKDFVKG